MTVPTGITAIYTYDPASQLTHLTHATLIQTLASYSYDAVDNRTQAIETVVARW